MGNASESLEKITWVCVGKMIKPKRCKGYSCLPPKWCAAINIWCSKTPETVAVPRMLNNEYLIVTLITLIKSMSNDGCLEAQVMS